MVSQKFEVREQYRDSQVSLDVVDEEHRHLIDLIEFFGVNVVVVCRCLSITEACVDTR